MRLTRLRLHAFRAHHATEVELAPGVNLFAGPNGAGKTNLLEGIHYLSLGKSFLTSTDAHVVQRGAPHFEVEGSFEGERRSSFTVKVVVVPGEGKRAFVNGSPLDRLADLVGQVPTVVISPADAELTAGGPSERRRFLDTTLSQAYPVYLDDLIKYRRALRQRNALLQSVRRGKALAPGTMDAWDEELTVLGSRIIERRASFLDGFAGRLAEAFELLNAVGEVPSLTYAPSVEGDDVSEAFRQTIQRRSRRERDLGRTLVGPHLDEIVFQLDGFDLRPYASQGQHRTFALAIRIAQALFFRDHLDETPILMLDDVFGPLDPERADVVLSLLADQTLGQSLITAARTEPFWDPVPFEDSHHAAFHVERGTATRLSSVPTTSST